MVNNADWLGPMQLAELLGYTRQITVAQLLERDDFARRFAAKQPITLSEFFYPLLQGIDSVEVHADIELGGTDQTFNNLVGRELQRAAGQPPQVVLTVPLLVGTDGVEKMGKSLDNYIAIAEPAARAVRQADEHPRQVVGMYARLCTALHPREVEQIEADVGRRGRGGQPRQAAVARRWSSLYHGADAARAAEEQLRRGLQAGGDPRRRARIPVAGGRSGAPARATGGGRPRREHQCGPARHRRRGGSHRRRARRTPQLRRAAQHARRPDRQLGQASRGAAR